MNCPDGRSHWYWLYNSDWVDQTAFWSLHRRSISSWQTQKCISVLPRFELKSPPHPRKMHNHSDPNRKRRLSLVFSAYGPLHYKVSWKEIIYSVESFCYFCWRCAVNLAGVSLLGAPWARFCLKVDQKMMSETHQSYLYPVESTFSSIYWQICLLIRTSSKLVSVWVDC